MTAAVTGLDIAHQIERAYPGAILEAVPEYAVVDSAKLLEVCQFLRDDEELSYRYLNSVTAVDRMEWFEVVYHLTSIRHNRITALKVKITDRETPSVPSLTSLWQGAHLQEREAYDLMGIVFDGHPDMRRIFLWDGFAGHPLRKDYLNLPGGQMAGLERFPGEPGGPLPGRG